MVRDEEVDLTWLFYFLLFVVCVLKDFGLAYLVLKVVSHNPMYLFLSWFCRLKESVASYIMFDVRQFCFNGHKSFCMQLHIFVSACGLIIFLLCELIMELIFGIQL